MKILAVTDVHQMISKWKELVLVSKQIKPDVVAIAGDLFPKDNSITGQLPFLKHFKKYLKQIKDNGSEIVVILGNDDNQNLIPDMEQGDKDGLWHYVSDKVVEIGGYEFVGMPWVPDYPFGYKYWCRGEFSDHLRIDPQQFTDPVIISADNKYEIILNYKQYLMGQKTIWQSLVDDAANVKNMSKSIWLIHCPPASMGLDVCAHGARVGSDAVLKFVKEYQPMLTIHGHIHESPAYNGDKWEHEEGNTLCIQAGQIGMKLHYTIIEIEDGKIVKSDYSMEK